MPKFDSSQTYKPGYDPRPGNASNLAKDTLGNNYVLLLVWDDNQASRISMYVRANVDGEYISHRPYKGPVPVKRYEPILSVNNTFKMDLQSERWRAPNSYIVLHGLDTQKMLDHFRELKGASWRFYSKASDDIKIRGCNDSFLIYKVLEAGGLFVKFLSEHNKLNDDITSRALYELVQQAKKNQFVNGQEADISLKAFMENELLAFSKNGFEALYKFDNEIFPELLHAYKKLFPDDYDALITNIQNVIKKDAPDLQNRLLDNSDEIKSENNKKRYKFYMQLFPNDTEINNQNNNNTVTNVAAKVNVPAKGQSKLTEEIKKTDAIDQIVNQHSVNHVVYKQNPNFSADFSEMRKMMDAVEKDINEKMEDVNRPTRACTFNEIGETSKKHVIESWLNDEFIPLLYHDDLILLERSITKYKNSRHANGEITQSLEHLYKQLKKYQNEEYIHKSCYPVIAQHFTELTKHMCSETQIKYDEIVSFSNTLDEKLTKFPPLKPAVKAAICGVIGGVVGLTLGITVGAIVTIWGGGFGALPGAIAGMMSGYTAGTTMALGGAGLGASLFGAIGFFKQTKKYKHFPQQANAELKLLANATMKNIHDVCFFTGIRERKIDNKLMQFPDHTADKVTFARLKK